ncbi:MAG: alanine--tRNA ligase [Candidatus Buchananbacteria bacterium]|nr:alanine--tRNA ligase [Candidatus Buchananbacteria bacterium]
MTAEKLRETYLQFFETKGHTIIPSASLIPENDPTVLFTTAGMHPLVPYLLGQKHPAGTRLTDVQKCIRTGDIDEIGDGWHLTFFEMLGNWSLGDYFKKEAIEFSFEFLTKKLKLPVNKLAVSCFAGETENNISKDEESAAIWQALGIPKARIAFLGREDNWWGPAGQTGPCGPDTEMFYWTGEADAPEKFDSSDKHWVEIWNDVFMQYNKTADGSYVELAQKNVDTGMGLERTTAILNSLQSVYETELFTPIIKKIKELSNTDNVQSIRIIADHLRTATFILGDQKGVTPSNIEQGYVLRRLIRRAIRHGKMIGISNNFTVEIAKIVIKHYAKYYPELDENKSFIEKELAAEEDRFTQTLEKGLKEFAKLSGKDISGRDAFILFASYGFPLEMTLELAKEKGIKVDTKGFDEEFDKHQELSRTASAGKFKGGLADHSAETTKLHTATHLLLAALRQVLGNHVYQKGSNITAERLRLDFSHPDKMTPEQIKQVEDLVNEQIRKQTPVTWQEVSIDEAKNQGAMGVFEHKYADRVKVYTIGDFSKEICGGPHVNNVSELIAFKITKEEASSSGVRRIKATVG